MALRKPVTSVPEGGNPTLGMEQLPTGDQIRGSDVDGSTLGGVLHDNTTPTGTGPQFEHYNTAERGVVDAEVIASAAHRADLANPHAVTALQAGADPAGSAAAVQANLVIHEADVANPHAVSLAQVGGAPAAHVGAGGVAEHPVFSNGVEGFVPDPGVPSGLFLKDDGTWATPAGGGTVQLVWRFDTSIVMAAPASGRWRMNNATPASVTALALHDVDRDGVDTSTILDNLTAGDAILIQQSNDATKYLMCDVVLSTDNTGWFQIDVTIADSGVIFDNNQDCLFIIVKGGGAVTPGDQAHVQARRSTVFAIPTGAFADVTFDLTDEENDPTVLDHDLVTNTDNIIIGADKGPTEIHVSIPIDAPASVGDHFRIEARLRTDDAVIIPGSEKEVWVVNDSSLNGNDMGELLDYTVQADLTGVGFITLQLQKISLSGAGVVNTIAGHATLQAVRLSGQVGAQGPAGGGSTILVEDEGVPLATAADTINFTGAGVTASGAGTTKTVNIPGGGGGGPAEAASAFHSVDQAITNVVATVLAFNSETIDTDTMHDNAVNNSRLTINTAGTWLFGFNGRWENNAAGNRRVRLLKNGTTIVGQQMIQPTSAEHEQCVTFPIQDAIVTDFFEIEVLQNSGGGLDMETAGDPSQTFWAHRQS